MVRLVGGLLFSKGRGLLGGVQMENPSTQKQAF